MPPLAVAAEPRPRDELVLRAALQRHFQQRDGGQRDPGHGRPDMMRVRPRADGGIDRCKPPRMTLPRSPGQDTAQHSGQRRPVRALGALVRELEQLRRVCVLRSSMCSRYERKSRGIADYLI